MIPSPAARVLTPGEWESLLYVSPDRIRPLVLRLAVHGAIPPPVSEQCPLCGKRQGEPGEQLPLVEKR